MEVTINVHVDEETTFIAEHIGDFVALRVGPDVDLFLRTSSQAKVLMAAAADAVEILKEMEVGPTYLRVRSD